MSIPCGWWVLPKDTKDSIRGAKTQVCSILQAACARVDFTCLAAKALSVQRHCQVAKRYGAVSSQRRCFALISTKVSLQRPAVALKIPLVIKYLKNYFQLTCLWARYHTLKRIKPYYLLTLPPDVFALSIPGFTSSSEANSLKWKSIPISNTMSPSVR